jgi:filamentous hemagglutinin family protein
VVKGNATVSANGNTITITATGRAILQGNTSIPAGTTVKVIQGINDILLRDTTGSATNILGSLLSNGDIILINAMGIYIGKSADVNVGGLIASTLDIKNQLFMSGTYQFEKIPGLNPAEILNEADINIANGGYLILLADRIVNKGTITAYMGTVAFGLGQQATVSFDQGGLVNLVIDQGLAQQLTGSNGKSKSQIVNTGAIYANGGQIQMTARLLETTLEKVVNNTGIIEANNAVNHDGVVDLTASGAIDNTGTIQAGSLTEQGETFHSAGVLDIGHGHFDNLDGAINISGDISGTYSDVDNINFTGPVTLTGDTILQADSGDTGTQGEIVMNGNALNGGGNNLTLTAGVNDTLDGSITDVDLLTLNSSTSNNVTFTSTGAAFGVATLQTNYGSLFSRLQGAGTSANPYMIYSDSDAVGGLEYIPTEGLGADYKLANNINAAETSSWNGGAGFTPIGNSSTPFTGNFNGSPGANPFYTISNLFIDLPATDDVGLFGDILGGAVVNTVLLNANVTGFNNTGALVGDNVQGAVNDDYITGSVSGSSNVGGLVGENASSGNVFSSYATGSVSGATDVGGLVGDNASSSKIFNSYATNSVNGSTYAGGLAGENDIGSSINNSYATGSVSGSSYVGGLAGINYSSISNSYATGSVSASVKDAGGLAGYNDSSISNSFSSGLVSGASNAGGFVGEDSSGVYSANFFDDTVNSLLTGTGNNGNVSGISGASTANMQTGSIFIAAGWDFNGLWVSGGGVAYPSLVWQGMNDGPFIGGNAFVPFLINNVDQLQFMEYDLSAAYKLNLPIDASATSTWNSGAGFTPVGNSSTPFVGSLIGGPGNAISNLYIDLPATNDVGLFGETLGSFINDVGLINVSINGSNDVGALAGVTGTLSTISATASGSVNGSGNDIGGLVGLNSDSSINKSSATDTVSGGGHDIGGLVGNNDSGSSVTNSSATGNVSAGGIDVGGLVGLNSNSSSIINSYATGNISGTDIGAGGLVGENMSSSILNSYATGSVNGTADVGGLVGENDTSSSIANSYAAGNVNGSGVDVGGLVGLNSNSSSITISYASGTVSGGGNDAGGLVGLNSTLSSISDSYASGSVSTTANNAGGLAGENDTGTISNSYATGSVNGASDAGGLVGNNDSNITNSFASGPVSGAADVGGFIGFGNAAGYTADFFDDTVNSLLTGTGNNGNVSGISGESTANMKTGSIFMAAGWDFNGLWVSGGGVAYPSLVWQGMNNVPFIGGTPLYPFLVQNINQLQFMEYDLSAAYQLNSNIDATATSGWNAGAGFTPVGSSAKPFTGILNGNGYTISNLFIELPLTDSVGLFSYTMGAAIENLGLFDAIVIGNSDVGSLAGESVSSNITDSYDVGIVDGQFSDVGGLVGDNNSSNISNSFASSSVSGTSDVGGLVGSNFGSSSISNSYATGNINASGIGIGGLVGLNSLTSSIIDSFATGSVSGNNNLGGLVGQNGSGSIINSYYTDSDHQNGIGIFEPGGPSAFFNTTHPVFTGSTPWDFNHTWLATGVMYPLLLDSFDVWSGLGNWSDPANWSKGSVPSLGSNVLFTDTNLNDSNIDAFGGNIDNLVIASNYTGNITESNDLNVYGNFVQIGGTFTGSAATLDVGGDLNLTGGTLTAPSGNFDLYGNWIHNGGTFEANGGNVVLNGVSQQINGNNTFYDLTEINGGSSTITFAGGDTQTVTGQLHLAGTDAMDQLSLRSTSSPSTWLLDLTGTVDLSYLNVKDSQATGTLAVCTNNCTDSGNNTGWLFVLPPPIVLPPPLSIPQQQEVTKQGYNGAVISIEDQAGNGTEQGIYAYWIPYGDNWANIQNDSRLNLWEADHAIQGPLDVQLLPSSDSKI